MSTYPDVTVHSMTPEIPDPYMNSELELRGQWKSGPVVAQINAGMYELIVIKEGEAEAHEGDGYRGVRKWDAGMWAAFKRTYGLACVFEGMEVWLPNRGSGEILPTLSRIGCLAAAIKAGSGLRLPLGLTQTVKKQESIRQRNSRQTASSEPNGRNLVRN